MRSRGVNNEVMRRHLFRHLEEFNDSSLHCGEFGRIKLKSDLSDRTVNFVLIQILES